MHIFLGGKICFIDLKTEVVRCFNSLNQVLKFKKLLSIAIVDFKPGCRIVNCDREASPLPFL